MKINNWIIVVVLLIAIGGYVWGFIQHKRNIGLEETLLKTDMTDIGIIDEELTSIRKSKELTIDELKKSKEKLDKLIDAVETTSHDTISVDDALKIIEGM